MASCFEDIDFFDKVGSRNPLEVNIRVCIAVDDLIVAKSLGKRSLDIQGFDHEGLRWPEVIDDGGRAVLAHSHWQGCLLYLEVVASLAETGVAVPPYSLAIPIMH